jgi:ceramide glucosyltransferase
MLLSSILATVYAIDRTLKLAAVIDFMRRASPPAPLHWPDLALLSPVTRGTHDIRFALEQRLRLAYPGRLRHIFICDAADQPNRTLCTELIKAHAQIQAELVVVPSAAGRITDKVAKLQAGLERAEVETLCFVDDDVSLAPDALQQLVPYLFLPNVGAVFGVAHYTAWETTWSSLMSLFVNANALISYIPLVYLSRPFTITGHCYAIHRAVFEAVGGFGGMQDRLDDDHELARRLEAFGLQSCQSPLIYDVENRLATAQAYADQLKRWFVFPRQLMLPGLTRRNQLVLTALSLGNLLPPLCAALALLRRRKADLQALLVCLGLFLASYGACEVIYRREPPPWRRWWLLPLVALMTPLHILAITFGDDQVVWRGRRLRVRWQRAYEVLED